MQQHPPDQQSPLRRGLQEVLPKLTNAAGGNAMFTATDLQFANQFIPSNFTDVPQDRSESYQEYREQKNQQMQQQKQLAKVAQINSPVTLPDRQTRYAKNVPAAAPLPPGPESIDAPISSQTKEIKRKVFIDSKDRDKVVYPDAADFVISWGRSIQNVKRLQLISLEFPNVVPAVTPSNNMLYWQNQEDLDLDPAYPTYSAVVSTGSYTLNSLQDEMTADMKTSRRHGGIALPDGSTPYRHFFIVDANEETNYIGFTSIIAVSAGNNPITTVAGSSLVTFKQLNHGYNDGERIHVIGVMGIVGGLSASDINGAFNIKLIDKDRFQFEIPTVAITSSTGGGTLVKSGREAPFQFLFGSYGSTIADILGFPVENSSQDVNQVDPLTSGIKFITGAIPGDPFTQIICPDHRLLPGDKVRLWNFNVSPSVYVDEKHAGVFEVYAVPSPDVFMIKYSTLAVTDITDAYVGTQIFSMYYPGHGFNRIVDIQQIGFNQVQVTTLFDHGYDSKSVVRITGTNSIPSIDGYYKVVPIDSDSFSISSTNLTSPLSIATPGYKGILAYDHIFYLYNVTPFGGFTSTDLNNVPFQVRDIIDADNFTFVGNYGYSSLSETGGGSGIRINSKLHGWRGTQSNSPNGVLYKNIRLSGDNYAYMCVPGLNSDSMMTTSPVKDIFAKLFITAVPGVVIFNQFDASPIDFPKILPTLSELRFQIRTADNYLVTFNGLDYSFGLEIVSEEQSDTKTGTNSTAIAPPGRIQKKTTGL